jgi:hypothetical protein
MAALMRTEIGSSADAAAGVDGKRAMCGRGVPKTESDEIVFT